MGLTISILATQGYLFQVELEACLTQQGQNLPSQLVRKVKGYWVQYDFIAQSYFSANEICFQSQLLSLLFFQVQPINFTPNEY